MLLQDGVHAPSCLNQIFHSPLIVLYTFVVKSVDAFYRFFFSQQRNLSIEGWFEGTEHNSPAMVFSVNSGNKANLIPVE